MTYRDDELYKDLLASIAKIIEEIINNSSSNSNDNPLANRSDYPYRIPVVFLTSGKPSPPRLQYEMIETESRFYVTVSVPATLKCLPWVAFMKNEICIHLDDHAATLALKYPVDLVRSHYRVHRRVLDITLVKVQGPRV